MVKRSREESSSDEEEEVKETEEKTVNDAEKVESSEANDSESVEKSFEELGVNEELCDACKRLGWNKPTLIQQKTLGSALKNRDIIALAETGSGKTGAFALPILQALMETPQKLFALVLTPTRELAFQISEQFEALGASIGLYVSTIVGGIDMNTQVLSLAKRPHVIVATPGRLSDHLENTKGFNLRTIKYLVLDEADRLLSPDFEIEFEKILRTIPKNRRTYLFSATMTKKVSKLERACLKDPVKVELSTKYQTVEKLIQNYLFIPQKYKEAYLVYILNEKAGNSAIVFCSTCAGAVKTALTLRNLGIGAVSLHGQMSQPTRLGALNKFKKRDRPVLVCTDVASRGLDIPNVDIVINYDVPGHSKDYIHRVGRTARAGRAGLSVTFVTQYDVESYQKIEQSIGKKLEAYELNTNDVMQMVERVSEAARQASHRYKELEEGKKRKKGEDEEEDKGRAFDEACVKKKKFRQKK